MKPVPIRAAFKPETSWVAHGLEGVNKIELYNSFGHNDFSFNVIEFAKEIRRSLLEKNIYTTYISMGLVKNCISLACVEEKEKIALAKFSEWAKDPYNQKTKQKTR